MIIGLNTDKSIYMVSRENSEYLEYSEIARWKKNGCSFTVILNCSGGKAGHLLQPGLQGKYASSARISKINICQSRAFENRGFRDLIVQLNGIVKENRIQARQIKRGTA